jgi:CHAT domain-containing protein
VVSLWLADDGITGELMSHLFTNLKLGAPPAVALQRAQAAIEADHPHPAAWAPFVVHGPSRSKGQTAT